MRILISVAAHQLFNTIVVPIVNYILSVWIHTLGLVTTKTLRQIQKLDSQAVIGVFSSVVGAVSKAEVYILLV